MQPDQSVYSYRARDTRHPPAPAVVLLVTVIATVMSSSVMAGGLVRVSDGENDYEGKVVSMCGGRCSLIDRQGHLVHLDVSALKTFEKLSSRFQPHSSTLFRDELRREFGGSYEVIGTTHYLVCAARGRAARYGELFEEIYRDVAQFYRVRGFQVHTPDVPLVAVVFQSQKEFVDYCVRDRVPPSSGLLGYYSLRTNRVALFDDERLLSINRATMLRPHAADSLPIAAATGISGEATNTIVHETTHQVGYNIGIHSRLGGTPLWVVEGLATVLEPDGMRHQVGRKLLANRVNAERLGWFEQQHRPQRSMGSLGQLIASDTYFRRNTLNSYSEAWAFSFFLLENSARRRDLIKYLQTLSQRDSSQPYTASDRLRDFQDAFGDISRLEVEFIRFMDRL